MWAEEEQALDRFAWDEVAAAAVQLDDDLLLSCDLVLLSHGVAIMPPPPRPLNPAPLGSASQEMPLCSAVPPLFQICSSALEHGLAPALIGLAHAFLSFVPDK